LSYFQTQKAILSTDKIMASDARSNGMPLSPEVPLLSTCKDLQSNSNVFGCDVRPKCNLYSVFTEEDCKQTLFDAQYKRN